MECRIHRVVGNDCHWTRPSPGRFGKDGFGDYVEQNGFGHEDWNFDLSLARDGTPTPRAKSKACRRIQEEPFIIRLLLLRVLLRSHLWRDRRGLHRSPSHQARFRHEARRENPSRRPDRGLRQLPPHDSQQDSDAFPRRPQGDGPGPHPTQRLTAVSPPSAPALPGSGPSGPGPCAPPAAADRCGPSAPPPPSGPSAPSIPP